MLISLIHGDSVFEVLAGEWDALASRAMTDTPFQILSYQSAWWRHLKPTGGSLHTVICRDEQGGLVGIGCFYLLEGLLYFNGCVEETDYLDLIVSPEHASEAWRAVFDCICGPGFPDWTAFDLCNVPEASPTLSIFPQLAGEYGLTFNREVHEVCPVVSLPGSFDEYLANLHKKQRHEIRRKMRRASGADVEFVAAGHDEDLEPAVDAFLDLLQKSTLEKKEWLNEGRRAVFHDVARASHANNTLQLLFAEVEGRKAAALFNFTYRDRIWVYNSGLDPTAFGNLSLGVVLTAKAIEMAIVEGKPHFDFLRGRETYKYRFGAEDTTIYRLQAGRFP
jgi:CelD/BcsL family acetyltransferase involved in cellulose biosynthesis